MAEAGYRLRIKTKPKAAARGKASSDAPEARKNRTGARRVPEPTMKGGAFEVDGGKLITEAELVKLVIEQARKKGGKDGAEQLRKAADKSVGRNSAKLAKVLTDKALGGDLASAKVLIGFADRKKPVAKPNRSLFGDQAAKWAAEPQWVWPEEEEGEFDEEA
jgi:hypothetical protein